MRECYSLDDLLRFSHYVDPESSRAIRRSVAEYSQAVIHSEWQALGNHEKDPGTEKCFITLMTVVIRNIPANALEEAIQQRLIDIAREAGEHRDERITKSLTRIPPTLMGFVHAISAALGALVFVYPFHHRWAGTACFTLVAAVLILANIVMTDLDNPFNGVYNVSSEPFSRLR
jgi:VIT1/CCC1 family predicted Fe2+/Mn2+ transporter